MKNNFLILLLTAVVFFQPSCSDGNNGAANNLEGFTTDLCLNLSGPTAGYYANAHGHVLPLTQIPTIANPGQQFIHSQYPALGFTIPQGYTATETQIGLGVDVLRNDNQVVWRYVPGLSSLSQIPILDIVAGEVNGLFAFYGHTGNFDVVCSHNLSGQQGNFIVEKSTRLLRFGNITALVSVDAYFEPSLGSTFASVSLASAPTVEFDDRIMDTFLPIHWQLLIIDNSVRDSDLDGTPDTQDNFPFDPDRQ